MTIKYVDKSGYIHIFKPDHPMANHLGYVPEHRLVYIEKLNCCLLPWVEIHHINGVTDDNRFDNLQPLTKSQHTAFHNKGNRYKKPKQTYRICHLCGLSNSQLEKPRGRYKNPYEHWYYLNGNPACRRCYKRIKSKSKHPKSRYKFPVGNKFASGKRIPDDRICSLCGRKGYTENGYERWYRGRDINQFICDRCYKRILRIKKITPLLPK